jgi:hypothetical protein
MAGAGSSVAGAARPPQRFHTTTRPPPGGPNEKGEPRSALTGRGDAGRHLPQYLHGSSLPRFALQQSHTPARLADLSLQLSPATGVPRLVELTIPQAFAGRQARAAGTTSRSARATSALLPRMTPPLGTSLPRCPVSCPPCPLRSPAPEQPAVRPITYPIRYPCGCADVNWGRTVRPGLLSATPDIWSRASAKAAPAAPWPAKRGRPDGVLAAHARAGMC